MANVQISHRTSDPMFGIGSLVGVPDIHEVKIKDNDSGVVGRGVGGDKEEATINATVDLASKVAGKKC